MSPVKQLLTVLKYIHSSRILMILEYDPNVTIPECMKIIWPQFTTTENIGIRLQCFLQRKRSRQLQRLRIHRTESAYLQLMGHLTGPTNLVRLPQLAGSLQSLASSETSTGLNRSGRVDVRNSMLWHCLNHLYL